MNLGRTEQRIRWITLGLLFGSAILLTFLDSTGSLDSVLRFLRDPVAIISSWTVEQTDPITDALRGPRDMQAALSEIERLTMENETLARDVERLQEIESKYQVLQELFNRAAETPELRRITANVIGRDTNPILQSIIIDKGYDSGVRVGMPVEAARGLIGQVYRVSNSAAQVALITESASAIPVRLGTTRATGILRGAGRGALPTIDWIDLRYQVEVGEQVTTSGLGGKFPADLVVGRVISVDRNEAELFQSATVQPAADMEAVETVFIVTSFNTIDTSIFEE